MMMSPMTGTRLLAHRSLMIRLSCGRNRVRTPLSILRSFQTRVLNGCPFAKLNSYGSRKMV